ncbi:hypothetical protein BgiBS90_027497 [Biomphalaria glabrata]|nr:hypothetical protein BgiBS90_027497 [Biomphalaria glabrata]
MLINLLSRVVTLRKKDWLGAVSGCSISRNVKSPWFGCECLEHLTTSTMKTSLATLFSVLMFTTLVNAVYYYKVPDCVVDFIQKVKTGQNFCLAARTYSNCSVERLHLPAYDSEWVYDEILQKWRSMGVNCSTTLAELHERYHGMEFLDMIIPTSTENPNSGSSLLFKSNALVKALYLGCVLFFFTLTYF